MMMKKKKNRHSQHKQQQLREEVVEAGVHTVVEEGEEGQASNVQGKWACFASTDQGGNGGAFVGRANRLYDRGHLTPMGDMWGDEGRGQATLHVANRAPHESLLNRQQWNAVEQCIRKFVATQVNDTVTVVTGVAGDEGWAQESGRDGQLVAIPRFWWKLVVTADWQHHLLFFSPNLSVQIAPEAVSLNSPDLPQELRGALRQALSPRLFGTPSMHARFNSFVSSLCGKGGGGRKGALHHHHHHSPESINGGSGACC